MKCRKQACSCKQYNYRIHYKWLNLFVPSQVQCKNCGKVYDVACMFKGMSMQYLDVLVKGVFLLCALYYIVLGFPLGVFYMCALILLLNLGIYPVLFKVGILVVNTKNSKR